MRENRVFSLKSKEVNIRWVIGIEDFEFILDTLLRRSLEVMCSEFQFQGIVNLVYGLDGIDLLAYRNETYFNQLIQPGEYFWEIPFILAQLRK